MMDGGGVPAKLFPLYVSRQIIVLLYVSRQIVLPKGLNPFFSSSLFSKRGEWKMMGACPSHFDTRPTRTRGQGACSQASASTTTFNKVAVHHGDDDIMQAAVEMVHVSSSLAPYAIRHDHGLEEKEQCRWCRKSNSTIAFSTLRASPSMATYYSY